MRNLIDPIFNKNLQGAKNALKENLQIFKSSQIIGRKISNLMLSIKSPKTNKLSLNLIIPQRQKRSESAKMINYRKSLGRSLSLDKILSKQDLKIKVSSQVSPHRVAKKAKHKSKKSSVVLQELPKLGFSDPAFLATPRKIRSSKLKAKKSSQMLNELNKFERPSQNNYSKIISKTTIKKRIEQKGSKFKEFNDKSKTLAETDRVRHNFDIGNKKRWKILNSKTQNDNKQQIEKSLREKKSSEFDEFKLKSDRGCRKLKKKKSIEVFSILKNKDKKMHQSAEAFRLIKSAETSYGDFLEGCYKLRKFQDFSRDQSIKPQDKLIRIRKKLNKKVKLKKKRKTKSIWTDHDKPTPVNRNKLQGNSSEEKSETSVENIENLQEKMRKLKQRVLQTKSTLMSKAQTPADNLAQVLKIQRWFRSQIHKKHKSSLTLHEEIQRENFSNIFLQTEFVRSSSFLVQSLEDNIFVSVDSEVKQLKTSNSIKSLNENSNSLTESKIENNESQSKKVQKVQKFPQLCLSSLLQSKNISGCFKLENSDNSPNDSLSFEYPCLGSEESSIELIKQISNLDIERQSDTSQSSIVSRQSIENFSSDEDGSRQDRENWIARYVERMENEEVNNSLDEDEAKEVFVQESLLEAGEELNDYSDQEKSSKEELKENENYLKNAKEKAKGLNGLQKLNQFEDYLKPAPLMQDIFAKPISISTAASTQLLLNKNQQVPDQSSKEILDYYPVESPRLISDTSYPKLSDEDSCMSELSNLIDPELSNLMDPDLCLCRIFQNGSTSVKDIIERPENRLIRYSDLSEEDSNSAVLYTDINPSAQLQSFSNPILEITEYDQDVQYIINNEVLEFLQSCNFKLGLIHVDTSLAFIEKYLKSLELKLEENEEAILELINTPAYQVPLAKLLYLQSTSLGKLLKFPLLELVLPQNLSSELKVEYKALGTPSLQIYLQMIFDCINEALNYIRPFDIGGLPHPWSLVSETLYGEGEIRDVVCKVMKLIKKWESVKLGMLYDGALGHTIEKVNNSREQSLNVIIAQYVRDNEGYWMDYEDEESQVKIEISKLAFAELIEETANLL